VEAGDWAWRIFGIALRNAFFIGMWAWVKVDPSALRYVALSTHAKALAQDMFQALWSFVVCVIVTVVVSMATKPKPDSELDGLVYGLTKCRTSVICLSIKSRYSGLVW